MLIRRLIICSSLLGAVIWSGSSAGGILPGNADGWHTWQLDEPGAATTMCCHTRVRGNDAQANCDLDSRYMGLSHDGGCAAGSGSIRIYVQMDKGMPKDILALSSACPVSTESAVADHGLVSAEENLDWFRTIIENQQIDKDIREMALFALVQSNSDKGYAYIDDLLSRR
jgi:hypothetical protein